MRKCLPSLLVLFLMILHMNCMAQTRPEISDPDVVLRDDLIHISYDIIGSTVSEKYFVQIEITDLKGNQISVKSLLGDIGEDISGGSMKTIIWKYEEDQVDLSNEIFFQVYATKMYKTEEGVSSGDFKLSGLIALSVALPGLALTRLNHGKPHWIKGVVGYGCIAGSVILNRKAINTFEHYLSPTDGEYAMDLYNTSLRQDNASEILAYAAIGIWVTDIVWTIFSYSRLDTKRYSFDTGGISIGTGFEPYSGAPLLAFRYKF